MNVEIGGEDHILPMDDLDVDVPILSVRRIVRRGNLVKFRRGGGDIQRMPEQAQNFHSLNAGEFISSR